MWTGTALQFYDASKRVEALGIDGLTKEDIDDRAGSLIPEGENSESHVRKFGFECEQGSLFGFQRQDRIQIAAGLRKNRDLEPQEILCYRHPRLELGSEGERRGTWLRKLSSRRMAMAAAGVKPGAAHHK